MGFGFILILQITKPIFYFKIQIENTIYYQYKEIY